MNSQRARFDPWLLAAAALALIPLLAILRPGAPLTADGQANLFRAFEVSRALQAGALYPRWAPDLHLGYGYPLANFYAPGAHMLAALIGFTGLGVARGVLVVQIIALFLYPIGAYLAAHSLYAACLLSRPTPHASRFTSTIPLAALLAAALYLYAPLRFKELFIQGNLSQWLAFGWLGWCAWALTQTAGRGSAGWIAVAGAILAGLAYAHHPSVFLAFPFLAVYAAALAVILATDSGARRQRLAAVGAAFLLALLFSAPYWLPAVAELRYVNIGAIEAGMFNVHFNMLTLGELLAPARVLDDAALNPTQPNSLGTVQALAAAAGIAVAVGWIVRPQGSNGAAPRRLGFALVAIGALLVAALMLTLRVTTPIWDALPLARFVGFPSRLLGPALLWAALLGGAVILALPSRWGLPPLLLALVLIPLSVAPYLFPRPFGPRVEPTTAELVRYEMGGGAPATVSADEYLPRWVEDADLPSRFVESLLAGEEPDRLLREDLPPGSTIEPQRLAPLEDAYRITLPEPAAVTIGRFFFPGWQATIDGRPVPVQPAAPYGLIEVETPAGAHELRLRFGGTPPRTAGALLALAGLAASAGLLWHSRHAPRESPEQVALDRRAFFAALGTILLVTGVLALVVGPRTRWFRALSPVEAPAGMQHAVRAQFANGLELIGYDLAKETVRQGDALAVRLYWRATQPQQTNSRPFLHLDAVTDEATWANQTKENPADKPTTSWPTDFYVVDDYRLEVGPEVPPVVASLRAGLLDEDGQIVPLADGGDVAALGPVWIVERDPLSARRLPGAGQPYRLGPDIELVGHRATIEGDPSELFVTLYWRAEQPLAEDYTVFLHVSDAAGRMIAQGDGPPAGGNYPSSAWLPGQIVADERRLPLPAGVDPSGLRFATGLYRLEDGGRLPVTDAMGDAMVDNQIPLNPVR